MNIFVWIVGLAVFGWLIFALGTGFVIYNSVYAKDLAWILSPQLLKKERVSAFSSHTKDDRIMNALTLAKERWLASLKNNEFEKVSIRTTGGLKLYAYIKEANTVTENANIVVLVHGLQDSSAGLAYLHEEYASRGWTTVTIDQRAHGESEGCVRTMGVREARDLSAWVDYIRIRFPDRDILLHGVSMGAATIAQYIARYGGRLAHVRGVVLDSCFESQAEVLYLLLKSVFRFRFLAGSAVFGASVTSFARSGVSFGQMNVLKACKKNAIPSLVFHGQKDRLVPLATVRRLHDFFNRKGFEVVTIPFAPHIGPYFYAKDMYLGKIEGFFASALKMEVTI